MKPTHNETQASHSKQAEIFNWQICDDDNEWHIDQQATRMAASTDTGLQLSHYWRRWRLVLVAITLLLLAVGVRWMQVQQEMVNIESEVRSAVEIEPQMIDKGVDHRPALDSFAPVGVQGTEILELGNGWARVRVTVQKEDGAIYRQTRVYQPLSQRSAEWEQVAANGRNWGRPRQWESTYFRFHYYAQDEEAVKAAAPKLDALYPTFHAALFAGDPPSQRVTVVIDPAAMIVSQYGESRVQDAPMTLPSPSSTLAPLEVSEEALLVQGAALALFNRLAAQSHALNQLPTGGNYVRSGLRLWLLWNQELPLARWREPLVRWVFSEDEGIPVPEKNVRVPAFAHDLCAHHRLWLTNETEINMPILCIQHVMGRETFLAYRYSPPPLVMPYFVGGENLPTREYADMPYASAVAFATLFEYVGTDLGTWRISTELNGAEPEGTGTEGAERVRALIEALPYYQNWNTLIPAIFGISREEFEAGLNNFLMDQYGVAP